MSYESDRLFTRRNILGKIAANRQLNFIVNRTFPGIINVRQVSSFTNVFVSSETSIPFSPSFRLLFILFAAPYFRGDANVK